MKRFVKVSLMLASAAILLSSCNCYKKMAKNADDVNITCVPTVLTLKGNTVSADITVTYPAAYFHKKAILKVTPVLVFEGGEIAGTPKYVQGEKVKDNYTVIAKAEGGSYTQTVVSRMILVQTSAHWSSASRVNALRKTASSPLSQ